MIIFAFYSFALIICLLCKSLLVAADIYQAMGLLMNSGVVRSPTAGGLV